MYIWFLKHSLQFFFKWEKRSMTRNSWKLILLMYTTIIMIHSMSSTFLVRNAVVTSDSICENRKNKLKMTKDAKDNVSLRKKWILCYAYKSMILRTIMFKNMRVKQLCTYVRAGVKRLPKSTKNKHIFSESGKSERKKIWQKLYFESNSLHLEQKLVCYCEP